MGRSVVAVIATLLIAVCLQAEQTSRVAAAAAPKPAVKSAPERAWDDLRWLATALEAYSTDNESLYAPVDGVRSGDIAALDTVLEWYYAQTYPKKRARPHLDPWGHPYQFVISRSRAGYALYSLGRDGTLGPAEKAFLEKLENDDVSRSDLEKPHSSQAILFASGTLVFAPREILEKLAEAR